MLFVGLSFTDPNVRHVLSLIRETFTEIPTRALRDRATAPQGRLPERR